MDRISWGWPDLASWRLLSVLLLLPLVASACMSNAGVAGSRGPSSSAPAQSVPSPQGERAKTLVLALEGEPLDPFVGSMSGGAGTIAGNLKLAVHQSLANYDDRGGLHPMLAESLPSRDDGSWVVRSDGTMTTT